jgi:DNA-directed RNA polymerase subunit RPC12/RpoP
MADEAQVTSAGTLDQALTETASRRQSIRATAAQFLGVPPNKVCDLLRNVWKTSKGQEPLSDAEMFMGMSMIARYGLDPIAREVFVTRTKGGLATIIGIDGWIKVLDRTEGYDGMEVDLHFSDEAGRQCDYCDVRIFSKKRSHPASYRAYMHEYRKLSGFVADAVPLHMLRIFALRHAARLFTPIGGSVVTEEEARWMDAYDRDDIPAAVAAPSRSAGLAAELARPAKPSTKPSAPNAPGRTEPSGEREPGDDDEPLPELPSVAPPSSDEETQDVKAFCQEIAAFTSLIDCAKAKKQIAPEWTHGHKQQVLQKIEMQEANIRGSRGERS